MTKRFIIGIDEAGRGPLAGPLAVGLVAGSEKEIHRFGRVRDSKKLTPKNREAMFKKIKTNKNLIFKTVFIGPKIIDRIGINKATERGIAKILKKIPKAKTSRIFFDGGLKAPPKYLYQKTIIKGDEKIPVIALASIVAKVRRDRYMVRLAEKYPQYGFEKHKGYGTKEHYRKIKKFGLSAEHRRFFCRGLLLN